MRLIYPIVILFLLISASNAQLAPDKERFDVVLHPGDLEERTLEVTNIGDSPIFKITKTQVSGTAREFIFLDVPEGKPLMPQDKAEIKIYFAIPPETKPGSYTGFIYLLDSAPPSLPLRIDFDLDVIGQESYGIDMTIDDAKSASLYAKAEEIAQFDLAVKNLGAFRDVASIDAGPLPDGWSVILMDGEKTLSLPYDLPLDPGTTHTMKLQMETSKPGKKGNLMVTATSLGNRSENSSVEADVEFGMAVRGYNVDIEIPEKMVANKSYKGSFSIMLDVKEKVMVWDSHASGAYGHTAGADGRGDPERSGSCQLHPAGIAKRRISTSLQAHGFPRHPHAGGDDHHQSCHARRDGCADGRGLPLQHSSLLGHFRK